ncbi:MAG: hypothetical protein ACLP7O_02805 [Terracidiphilus sp.]
MPAGWLYVAGFGIRQMTMAAGTIAASVGVGQDTLNAESGLPEYIETQKKLIGSHLKEAKFAGPQATAFAGADEARLLFVRHNVASAGSMLHAQTYVRLGHWLGIITLTALEGQLRAVRADYEAFVKGLRISPERASEPTARI